MHPAQTRIMYAADGSSPVREWECEWLHGYEGSTPVRFGNAAAAQAQHDIYGEVLNALYVARRHGLPSDVRGTMKEESGNSVSRIFNGVKFSHMRNKLIGAFFRG
jgi:GH15 family glucan-1,4-alpha-glucosidase